MRVHAKETENTGRKKDESSSSRGHSVRVPITDLGESTEDGGEKEIKLYCETKH